jgi:hypothetical protein
VVKQQNLTPKKLNKNPLLPKPGTDKYNKNLNFGILAKQ